MIKRYIFPVLLAVMFIALPFVGLAASEIGHYIPNPYPTPVEPDSTKLIYPLPVNTGDPMHDLYNSSPLYLNDPTNFNTEIIYDPLTRQYTFKRRVGDFYYDTPTTMTENEYLEYQSKKGIMEYWKERRSQNARSTTNGNSIIPPMFI